MIADVTDEDEIAAALADAASSGPLRIVIASAGGSASIGPFCQLNTAGWRATLDLNATGTMLTLKYATQEMARVGGAPSWRSPPSPPPPSTAGSAPTARPMPPSTTWWRWPPMNWAGSASASTASGPESSNPNWSRASPTPAGPGRLPGLLPLSRVGAPADIAEAARFLAGPESAWITGEVINVDGGQHLRRGPDYTAMFEPMFGAAALRGLPDDHAGRLPEGPHPCAC